ncbi:MAG: MFS transporter [Pseudomonadota bacterium]
MTNDGGLVASLRLMLDRKTVAGGIGNTLEWFDFAVYGFFAPIIAKQFFPTDDPTVGLIATFGVFAAGFMMRPIGGVIIGHFADKLDRRSALVLSVAMMAVPTTAMAFLPTYEMIGIAAPLLLTFLRLAQGVSVGGEYTSSVTYLVENGPQNRRGLFGCIALIGSNLGLLAGAAAGALVTGVLSDSAVESWGWRVPFLFGLVLGLIGIYLRRQVAGEAFTQRLTREVVVIDYPIVHAIRHHWQNILHVIGINVLNAVGYYIAFVYITTYLQTVDGVSDSDALNINTGVLVALAILVPLFAALSDRIGRKPVMLTGALAMLLCSYPLFLLLHSGSLPMIVLGQLGFALIMGCFTGPLPTTMTEQLPSQVRVSAYSIGFNLPFAAFGGTAPLMATFLIGFTHDDYAPAYYVMAAAAVAVVTLLTMRETKDRPLP